MNAPAETPAAVAPTFKLRMVKIGLDGQHLPADATGHVAVLLPDLGLMFDATPPKLADTWQKAKDLAAKSRMFGFDDWRLPEIGELMLLIDHSRFKPAIDVDHFPHTPTNDWYWSATAYAPSPSGCAWCVYFYNGFVGSHGRRGGGFVRPVRRLSSGQ